MSKEKNCPKCDGHGIGGSWSTGDGIMRHIRTCQSCGHIYCWTIEEKP